MRNKLGRTTLPNIKAYHGATVIKTIGTGGEMDAER
jgi:hypothetical protein